MPLDPKALERSWPRTAALLRRYGCVWDAPGELLFDPAGPWRGRREAVVRAGAEADPALLTTFTRILLSDSRQEVRQAALMALDRLSGDAADAAVALGMADSRGRRVRGASQGMLERRGPAGFLVLLALFEDRAGGHVEGLLLPLGFIAERHPRLEMRAALPVLEKEARRFFQTGSRRRALQETIRRIEAATETLKSLPLAAAPTVTSGGLPVPAAAPETPVASARALPWWRRWWPRRTG